MANRRGRAIAACRMPPLNRRSFLALGGAAATSGLFLSPGWASGALERSWDAIREAADGQEVFFNAWGGSSKINDYIAWAGAELRRRHGVRLRHVKVSDIAESVSRVLAERSAGRREGGSVDLMWINGENFRAMKENDLLYGPFARDLPNWQYVDVDGKPTTTIDFTVPTEGYEAPWGMAQLVFIHDAARLTDPPRSMAAMLDYARANPGRLTYPRPPHFLGTTFLKQAALSLAPDRSVMQQPAAAVDAQATLAPMWQWLEAITPHLWRSGNAYPSAGPELRRLLADRELDIAFDFNPASASADIEQGLLPPSVRTYVLEEGTIGNTHFVAIPFNASAPEGALVTANFLMSPVAQARKANPEVWGDPTVLDVDALPPTARERFEALPRGVATLTSRELGQPLLEPHPSWVERIEDTWLTRFGQ